MICGLARTDSAEKKPIRGAPAALVAVLSVLLSGCGETVAFWREPTRLYTEQEEIKAIRSITDNQDFLKNIMMTPDKNNRNNYITMRMYAIDLEYTNYEAQLTHSSQGTNLLGTAATLALNGTATVIPAGQTTKVLNAFAGGITGGVQAVDKEILMSKAIQDLQTQMRTDRNNEAKIILADMNCNIEIYPLGRALSDLEVYYRAGTLAGAEIGLSKTVSAAEAVSKDNKNSVNPSPKISTPAKDNLKNVAATLGVPPPSTLDAKKGTETSKDCPLSKT